ncbi:hypothetical protein LOTGIDRAFT_237443 [Lottia gigantea]|uniref:UBC core domain-containing protein n=1 Tax=Lottia gigantea TaxID=225164 RepID=V4BEM9_LOTGI|nr:hypothetical protein LOTGIDRAFT_237443 [Lottia gigantea]ESP04262.1 hypothetical protein LOTGIDRAFT_237443 [Lottia gigantea]
MSALREIHHLMKNLASISNGQAKLVKFEHPKSTIDIYLELSPTDGFYKGGTFLFIIQIHPNFPITDTEAITCMTPIYHPNIDSSQNLTYGLNNVCLNVDKKGRESLGLTGIVAGLLYLLYNPELEDPLWVDFGNPTLEEFKTKVKAYMNGVNLEGFSTATVQENMDQYRKQEQDEYHDPKLDEEVRRQEEAMDTDDENSESFRPLENSDAMQLYSLIQHQNSIVQSDDAGASDCSSQGEITPFSVPENFREEFQGYKLTKHGTTVIRDEEIRHTSNDSPISPLFLLTKRFTT